MTDLLASCDLVAFVGVSDLDRARKFYVDTLGLGLLEENPAALVIEGKGTTLRVALVPAPQQAGYTVLGWTVPEIQAAMTSLTARGVIFERFPGLEQDVDGVWTAPGGAQVAWFKDPDDNVLSLTQLS
jgi:catechol 2,3-dioxygenase-like lactoylglutathione lyase family enzyme